MERIFTRSLILAFAFCCFVATSASAQVVTISYVDPGPYGQGSTIGVAFHLNTSTACASSANVFNLYLSDANGNFGAPILIGNYTGFYGTFVNGVIPKTTTASTKYRIRIQCTDPAIAPVTSGPFEVRAVAAVTAGVSSQAIDAAHPDIFGACIGTDNTAYPFVNTSSGGAAATASFFNELSQTNEGVLSLPNQPFIAKAANYTVFVKAVDAAGTVGTKAYSLINNPVNNSFGASGSNQVCLNGQNKLSYSVDINSPNGIQKNYPGLIYNVTWGDGLSTNYTLCDIVAAGGFIDHTYKKASCGNVANGLLNVFQIDLQPTSPICGKLGTPVTGYARVVAAPKNIIQHKATACTNTPVTFGNQSIPGQDPNSTSFDCTNKSALYTWVVDGVVVAVNYPLEKGLEYTFTTNGQHFVGLHLQNGSNICDVKDTVINICIQNPPKPSFTLPGSTICTSGSVTPQNTSVVDEICDPNTTYTWRVTPNTFRYINGTNANSKVPQFDFNVSGVYTVQLDITTESCGLVASEPQEVVINLFPVARLSANALICGKDQVISFSNTATTTRTTLSGTSKTLPTTYTWTVTGGAFSFANGTNANSKYPDIRFSEYKTYTIKVDHVNNCGPAQDSQRLTFQEAPIISPGGDRTICEGSSTFLDGDVTGVYNSLQWVGGTGTFSPGRNVKKPTYTPSAAEIAAGTATISLQVTTNLAAPCNVISAPVVISITRKDNITSAKVAEVCTGTNFTHTITSQNPASTYSWTASVITGTATGFGPTGSGNTINDVINDTGTGDAVVRYIITPTTNLCPGNPDTLLLTVNKIPVLTGTPSPSPICSGQPTGAVLTSSTPNTTYTWTSVADADIQSNTDQTTPVAVTTIPDMLTNMGTTYATVKYIITPYHGACAGQPFTLTVTVAPAPIAAQAGPDDAICVGPSYTLQGNNPSPGTGQWALISGQAGVTFSNSASPTATVNGLQPGNVYQFVWSINTSPNCSPTTDTVSITVDEASVGGTIAGSASVCADANAGFLNLSGNVGNVLHWESSTDGVNWVTQLNNTTAQYEFTGLTQTTQFRAVVQNGVCNIAFSAAATITVNQPVMAANGGTPLTTLCNAATVTLNGNDPTPFAGIWTQTAGPPVIFADASNPKTLVSGLIGGNTYKFTWTIKAIAPCADSQNEITIVNNPDVTPKFTSNFNNTVCGPVSVEFTNTSTPVFTTTTYLWDFGDGTGNSNEASPQHTFLARTDGRDTVYTVSLSIINNCFPRLPYTMNITVRPAAPLASILPERLSGCGSLAIKLKNTSPGTNKYYDFFVYDGNTKIFEKRMADKSDVTFDPLGPPRNDKFYTVYMVATDLCDNTSQSTPIPINIFPATFVPLFFPKDNKSAACYPFTATFVNISSGGDTFFYRIYDTNGVMVDEIQGSKTEQPYTFAAAGTYFVSIVAQNPCATFESTERIKFEAYPKPLPNFDADIKSGCKAIRVSFTNTTPANGITSPQSLSYEWDFGDGTPHFFGYTPLPHVYSSKSPSYTVTLTVTNLGSGCTDVITKADFIKVNAAPNVEFNASPGFITKIPNYYFAFDDQTSGNPVSWQWDFGDNTTSTQQNPGHTYADTGTYKVTLRVINRDGCDSTVAHNVQITGVPGQLYIPNAFMPASNTTELRTFVIKGSGILSWHMQIFNNWGQLVWETTKLDSKGEPVESWDGIYKGVAAQQGVYIWQASAKFINGTEWKGMQYGPNTLPKRTGVIHLIR